MQNANATLPQPRAALGFENQIAHALLRADIVRRSSPTCSPRASRGKPGLSHRRGDVRGNDRDGTRRAISQVDGTDPRRGHGERDHQRDQESVRPDVFSAAAFLYVGVEAAVYVWMPTLLAGYHGRATWLAAYGISVFFALRAAGRFLGAWMLMRLGSPAPSRC